MANVTFDSEVAFHSSRVICQDTPAVESPKSSLCTRIQRLPFAHLTQALIATAVSLGVVSISSGTQTAVGLPQPDSFSVYKASGASPGQDVQPFATQSDPVGFESGGGGTLRGSDGISVDLFHLAVSIRQIDIALPNAGPGVVISRSFNGVQVPDSISPSTIDISGSRRNSDGWQGWNWMQSARPELVRSWSGTGKGSAASDRIYLIAGADYAMEFKRAATDSDTFLGVNGTQAAIVHTENTSSGTPGLYEYRDTTGTVMTFFDFDGDAYGAAGQLWKTQNADGSGAATTAYIGHESTISSALAGFIKDGSGHATAYPGKMFDSIGREYEFTYGTYGGKTRVASIIVNLSSIEVARVEYVYYATTESGKGLAGDLKTAMVTLPVSSGGSVKRTTYFRYYTDGTWNGTTNAGHPHQIKLIIGPEGTRTYGSGFDSASDAELQSYAAATFTYGSDARLATALFNGECHCSDGGMGGNGTYTLSLEANIASAFAGSNWNNGSYDCSGNWTGEQWALRAITTTPDNKKVATYFDEAGQVLGTVKSSANDFSGGGNLYWINKLNRDSSGRILTYYTSAVFPASSYTHTTGGGTDGGTLTTASSGLTLHRTYSTDTYLPFAITQIEHSNGPSSTKYGDRVTAYLSASSYGYYDHGAARLARPLIDYSRHYITDDVQISGASASDYAQTSYGYTFWSSTWRLKSATITHPTVVTGANGSGSASTSMLYLDELGRAIFTREEGDRYIWTKYDSTGLVAAVVDDPNSSTSGANSDKDTWSISLPAAGLARLTQHYYDDQGRQILSVLPSGRLTETHYTALADGQFVTLTTPAVTGSGGSTTRYSPVSYSVANLAGRVTYVGTIAFTAGLSTAAMSTWINETESDPIEAVTDSDRWVAHLSSIEYDNTGTRRVSSTVYHSLDDTVGGSTGDPTAYLYDAMGRLEKVTDPTGTIDKTVYDAVGRAIERWTGTVDGGGGDNMTKTHATVYDGGGAGNGYVTKRIAYVVNSTTDQRVTDYSNDYRGRARFIQNAAAPHFVMSYDNLGRVLTTAAYGSAANLSATTDPTASASNRVGRDDTAYDARGRVWKTTRHKITQSGGGAGGSTDTLEALSWYDSVGRTIKTIGQQMTKTEYDRLGRVTRRFVLGSHDDTTYAHAADVSGDIVMEESHTTYDDYTGLPIVRATIQRHPNASTTAYGALYSTTPGTSYSYTDIAGRISITAMYYDALDRQTDSAAYGTASISATAGSWALAGSVPGRSDSILVTTTTYGPSGLAEDAIDPMGRSRRMEYDAAGRKSRTIDNYTDGTPGGGTNDDQDQVIVYSYTNGLLATKTADLPSGQTDQVTTYTYGVTRGAGSGDSRISSGRHLWKVAYPDSTSGTDVVTYAYNAQNQGIYLQDQAGNVIVTNYDLLGREASRVAESIASEFDTTVQAVATEYLPRGLMDTVTQYSNTSMTTATDQIRYEYDDWGGLASFTQDVDGIIGAGGIAARSVSYDYSKAAPSGGAAALRRTSVTLPGSFEVIYDYNSGAFDDTMSRCGGLKGYSDTFVTYQFIGVSEVARTTLVEPQAQTGIYEDTSGIDYTGVDVFGRITRHTWQRLGGAIYTDSKIEYDRNGNVLVQTDELTARGASGGGWTAGDHLMDSVYSFDSLNRLTKTDEGTMTGSVGSRSIASSKHTRIEEWTLSQTGNWNNQKLDLNGDGDQADSGERDWNMTFNPANEFISRDGVTATPPAAFYDASGNLIDDAKNYTYVYDVFGRLKTVKTRGGSPVTVSEYKYNGLGYRTGWHYDANNDSSVDGGDPWYWFFYDERWRVVAVYRGSDSDPKERVVHHSAGFAGYGGSSYIDSVAFRDSDDSVGWDAAAPDDELPTRYYYLQNWRSDVIALIQADGTPLEYIRYSAYGVPFVYSAADVNRDGVVDIHDVYSWDSFTMGGTGDIAVDPDINRDGVVDSLDADLVWNINAWGPWSDSGLGYVSRLDSRKGYSGYEFDPATTQWHVRRRVLVSHLGSWNRRDLSGYGDGMSLYNYVRSNPINYTDVYGRCATCPTGGIDIRKWIPFWPTDMPPDEDPVLIPNMPRITWPWSPGKGPTEPGDLGPVTDPPQETEPWKWMPMGPGLDGGFDGSGGWCVQTVAFGIPVALCLNVTATVSASTCICPSINGGLQIIRTRQVFGCITVTGGIGVVRPSFQGHISVTTQMSLGLGVCPDESFSTYGCITCGLFSPIANVGCRFCGGRDHDRDHDSSRSKWFNCSLGSGPRIAPRLRTKSPTWIVGCEGAICFISSKRYDNGVPCIVPQ